MHARTLKLSVESKPPRESRGEPSRRRGWIWVAAGASTLLVLAVTAAQILVTHAGPLLKHRVVTILSRRLGSRVELDGLQVSVWRGDVSGEGLRVFSPDERTPLAGTTLAGTTLPGTTLAGAPLPGATPLLQVRSFRFHTGIFGLLGNPMRVSAVHVSGVTITVPPRPAGYQRAGGGTSSRPYQQDPIRADQVVCDGVEVVLIPTSVNAEPRRIALKTLTLNHVGPDQPWPFEAVLLNDAPRGQVRISGGFGPWVMASPGDTPLTGSFQTQGAQLEAIRGLGGSLEAAGQFTGSLSALVVTGTASSADFSMAPANHPLALRVRFAAQVDGASGTTQLDRAEARLGESDFVCRGSVLDLRGQGHRIDLNVQESTGRVQDFLLLAVHSAPPLMTGTASSEAKLHVDPGDAPVAEKATLTGTFLVSDVRFRSATVQGQVDAMSERAQGDPKEATHMQAGAPPAEGTIAGRYRMTGGRIDTSALRYTLPGATLTLHGSLTRSTGVLELTGSARTQADLSGMEAVRWKKLLLLPLDPFFRRKGAGAEVPVKVSGTGEDISFAVNVMPER